MMLYNFTVLALLALGLAPTTTLAQSTCGDDDNTLGTIVDIACAQENADTFGTLCLRLRQTGLDDALTIDGDWFVFAPTNTAFQLAGPTAGVTVQQQSNVLQYHVSVGSSALVCGTDRTSILSINGIPQTHTTQCSTDGLGTLVGQAGDIRIPTPSDSFPLFTGTTPGNPDDGGDFIEACNGIIAPIGGVLGFDNNQYNFGLPGCSFYDPNCVLTGKAAKKQNQKVVGGVAFTNVGYYYGAKGSKGGYYWNGFNQNFYANQAYNAFNPYFGGPPPPTYYYGNKKAKKGGYYGGYYYGYGAKGAKGGFYPPYWRNRKLEKDSVFFDNGVSEYEPEEYYKYDAILGGFPEQ